MKKSETVKTMTAYRAAAYEVEQLLKIRADVEADPDYWIPWRPEDEARLEDLERLMESTWDTVRDIIDGIRGTFEGLPLAVWVRYYYTGDASGIPCGTTVSTDTEAYDARERAMIEAIGRVRLRC